MAPRWGRPTLACFALFFVGLIVFSPIVQVREIRVQRDSLRIDAEKVQRSLSPVFGRHLLFLSTQEVAALLRASISDIGDVAIDKDYPSRLTVRLTLEPITARLVIVAPDDARAGMRSGSGFSAGANDFLTVNGRYIVDPNPDVPTDLPVLFIVDWGVRPNPGDVLIAPDVLETIYGAEEIVRQQFGWDLQRRIVYLRAREFHLKTQTITLWMDLRSPLSEQFARLTVFLRSVPAEEAKEYVDLRLSDRIVYK